MASVFLQSEEFSSAIAELIGLTPDEKSNHLLSGWFCLLPPKRVRCSSSLRRLAALSHGFDIARFEGVDVEDLWFNRESSNLLISVVGTDDRVEVEGWYKTVMGSS